MPASRMCQGVWKSGSPTEREITSSISLAMSKNFRMPEGLIRRTVRFTKESYSITKVAPSLVNFFIVIGKHHAAVLVLGQHKVGGGGKHPADGGQALGHEHGDVGHGLARDSDGQIVAAGHEVDALHLGEVHHPAGNLVKAGVLLGGDPQLDKGGGPGHLGALPVAGGVVPLDDALLLVF